MENSYSLFQGNSHCVDFDAWGRLCVICLEAHVKLIQGVMGRRSGWHHKPGSYKACPNKAVTRTVWNCPCLIWCCLSVFNFLEMASKQQQAFRMCVHPCPCYLTGGDTHFLCVACLGEEHKRSALEGVGCEHCDVLPFRTLRSRLAQILKLFDSEELDVVSVNARDTEDSPPQSRAYEEFFEVVTKTVDWPAERTNVDAGAPVTGTHRVYSVGCEKNKAKPVTHCQTVSETVRYMAAASNVIPFGLLYMRPLQWWLRIKGFSLRGDPFNPFRMIKVMRRCLRALVMWKKSWFLSQCPVLGASCRRKMLTTDASLMGWGAILEGSSSKGLWKDHHLSWHINRLEMLTVFLALKNFLADLSGHHVLVRSDNTLVFSYINHQVVCGHVHLANLRAKSSCGPKDSCCLFKQLTSRGSTM